MLPMVIIADRTPQLLRELASDLESCRAKGGHWFGRYSMSPLSLTDRDVDLLLLEGLIVVLEWDEPEQLYIRPVEEGLWEYTRTRSRPDCIRLSTDGWALMDWQHART